jgi:hypothetical protein
MQTDGRLVLRDAAGVARWEKGGAAGSWLALQNDGNLVLRDWTGKVFWASGTARYLHFRRSAQFITDEMKRNAVTIKSERVCCGPVDARGLFFNMVREGRPWDHKDVLRRTLPITTLDAYYFDVPGVARTAINYDFFSNLHYGYVGREAGITSAELIKFQQLHLPGVTGRPDPGDTVAVRAGIAMHDRGQVPTAQAVTAAAQGAIGEYRSGGHAGAYRDLAY